MINFTVYGNPFGWQRAGQNRQTGAVYTQPKTKSTEELIAWEYRRRYKDLMFPAKTPLCLYVDAYIPIPKSTPRRTQAKMITGEIRPIVKPDWDNLGKLVSDALNAVAYDDDKCIIEARVRKYYSETPRTEITIKEFAPPA